jgi:sugar phosphate isomerase/epimerase
MEPQLKIREGMMNYPSRVVSVKRVISFVILAGLLFFSQARWMQAEFGEQLPSKLKTSLNAYSFNGPLSDGSMDLDSLLEYCAGEGFDAVDITAYYFPGYPAVPSDEYLYLIKRKAFRLGLEISGTGVRNDFTNPDSDERRESIRLVKNWIIAAEKLGAPVIRIFAGKGEQEGYTREQLTEWLLNDVKECVEFGKQHGVVVAIQNHNEFLKNAGQVVEVMEKVDSEWFGLILDIGSFRESDAYRQVEQAIPWAVSWQIKEQIYMNGKSEKPDLVRLLEIIKKSGYRGYLPIETLGQGDPVSKVHDFFAEFKAALEIVF